MLHLCCITCPEPSKHNCQFGAIRLFRDCSFCGQTTRRIAWCLAIQGRAMLQRQRSSSVQPRTSKCSSTEHDIITRPPVRRWHALHCHTCPALQPPRAVNLQQNKACIGHQEHRSTSIACFSRQAAEPEPTAAGEGRQAHLCAHRPAPKCWTGRALATHVQVVRLQTRQQQLPGSSLRTSRRKSSRAWQRRC